MELALELRLLFARNERGGVRGLPGGTKCKAHVVAL